MSKQDILGLAQRYRVAVVPIEKAATIEKATTVENGKAAETAAARTETRTETREFIGYVRIIDLAVSDSPDVEPILPLMTISNTATRLGAVMAMQSAHEELALVVNAQGQTIGIATLDQLREPLFRAAGT